MNGEPPEVPPPEIGASPKWADSMAIAEERKWNDLDKVRNANDVRWLWVYGNIVVILTAVFAMLFIASLVTWAWHYLAPPSCGWLTPEQLSKVQSVLFSGGMGAVLSSIVQRQISKDIRH